MRLKLKTMIDSKGRLAKGKLYRAPFVKKRMCPFACGLARSTPRMSLTNQPGNRAKKREVGQEFQQKKKCIQ